MKILFIIIGIVLLVFWAIGVFFKLLGATVHLALIVAFIFLGISLFKKPPNISER